MYRQTNAAARQYAERGPNDDARASGCLPDAWTPEHVERQLLAAFRINAADDSPTGPRKGYGSAHPTMSYSPTEIFVRDAERENLGDEPIPLQVAATRDQLSFVERVIAWLAMLFDSESELRIGLRNWLRTEVKGANQQTECRKRGELLHTLIHRKNEALRLIAVRLNHKRVAVF